MNNIGDLANSIYINEFDSSNITVESISGYLSHYYTKQTRNTIRGIANDTNGNIISVRDGDNAITFVNKNEVSKVYKTLAQDANNALGSLVAKYNIYQASPRQVGGIEAS